MFKSLFSIAVAVVLTTLSSSAFAVDYTKGISHSWANGKTVTIQDNMLNRTTHTKGYAKDSFTGGLSDSTIDSDNVNKLLTKFNITEREATSQKGTILGTSASNNATSFGKMTGLSFSQSKGTNSSSYEGSIVATMNGSKTGLKTDITRSYNGGAEVGKSVVKTRYNDILKSTTTETLSGGSTGKTFGSSLDFN